MLKLVGVFVVLLGSTALGIYKSSQYVSRLNNLYEIKKAFLYIQGEIRYMNTPMAETMEAVAGRMKGSLRKFFHDTAIELEKRDAIAFSRVWDVSVKKNISKDILEKEAVDELLGIGSQLGCLDLKAQERVIDYFLEKWEILIERRQKEKNNRLKLYYMCGIMGGLLTVIILI